MADRRYVLGRYGALLSYLGAVLSFASLFMATPLLIFLWRPEELAYLGAFLVPAAAMGVGGVLLWRLLRRHARVVLNVREGGVIVLLSWLSICLFSAWTFTMGMGLPFRLALFEAVSGWTTTGLSVVDVTNTPYVFLLWRSTMQLLGGAGLAIIMLASLLGPPGAALSVAEGRENLLPQVRQSAKLVLIIYVAYVVAGIVGLYLAGMGWFDAINHSFAAVSTGGFSTRPESIGYWDSVAVEAVTLPLMILGNLSFVTAWAILRGRLRAVGRNGELRVFGLLLVLGVTLVFLLTARGLYASLDRSLRVSLFDITSAITTTGFSTVGYSDWNSFGWLLLIFFMVIGGGAGSTAGGLKQVRFYVLWKSLTTELRRTFLPRNAVVETPLWLGDRPVFLDDARLRQTTAFAALYLLSLFLGAVVMTAAGYGLKEALFEFASTLGTVGLSVGVTAADAAPAVHWAQILGMFLGRLEFMVVIAGMAKIGRDLRFLVGSR